MATNTASSQKNSFILYNDWQDIFQSMSLENAGKLIQAIFRYAVTGTMLVQDKSTEVIYPSFVLMKKQIDINAEKYADTCKKRSKAGKQKGKAYNEHLQANDSICFHLLTDNDTENENENENDTDTVSPNGDNAIAKEGVRSPQKRVFVPPTVDEVREYCFERGNGIDPQEFCDFYASKGWLVGKTKMTDWKAALRGWESRKKKPQAKEEPNENSKFANEIAEVVAYFNEVTGMNYKPTSEETAKHIRARLSEGFTVEDCKTVICKKHDEWICTDMAKYIRPETLFGSKFESYLNQTSGERFSGTDHRPILDWEGNIV